MDATSKEEKPFNPRAKANILEIITFRYTFIKFCNELLLLLHAA